jgi:folate-binding protein YgfZ
MDETSDPSVLTADAAVVDPGALEVVRVSGGDRVTFLHRLLTGNVAGLPVGAGVRALLLNLKGHIVTDMRVFVAADEVRLVVAPGEGEATAAALSRYAVMDDVTCARDAGLAPLALLGPRSGERLAAAGIAGGEGAPWTHQEVPAPEGPGWLVRARALGASGAWLFAGEPVRQAVAARLAAAGVRRLAAPVAEALRIASGEPAWGLEITGEYFPMEVNLGGAIDYAKGCYLGQEPIVRIRDRGHVNWRLVRLEARDPEAPLPARGDGLEADVKPRAGRVTSAARLPGAPPVALALLHVSVPAGAEVRIQHGDVRVAAVAREVPLPP